MIQGHPKKRVGVCLLGIVLGVLGIAIATVGWGDVLIRSFGMLILAVGAFLISASRVHSRNSRKVLHAARSGNLYPTVFDRPRRFVWILGVISLVASCVFFALMVTDAQSDHQKMWMLYAFFASSTVLIITCGYIAGLLILRVFSRLS